MSQALGTSATDITLVQRVKTGFAITAKNEASRKELLDFSVVRRNPEIHLEPASNLVAMQIATVPETIRTLAGPIAVTAKMVADEVTRVTQLVPFLVRPHGTIKPEAPYSNWQALFPRESAPRRLWSCKAPSTSSKNRTVQTLPWLSCQPWMLPCSSLLELRFKHALGSGVQGPHTMS